jgi:hemerythrin
MSPDREQVVLKLRQDHEYMVELMHRITSLCARRQAAEDCDGCPSGQRGLCHDNIEQLIRTFVEVTLRHNLIESAYMAEIAPPAHRIAHNRAHLEIAEQMKAIRVVFAHGGNGIAAIDGIDRALETIAAHLVEFDKPLEQYLLDAA